MSFVPFEAAGEAADALRARCGAAPAVAVVLGSGLGAFADRLESATTVDYADLPHFPKPGVAGHSGRLVVGNLPGGGARVAALAGRVHLYEGHPIAHVVHPTRTLARWGVKAAVFTNAAGGMSEGLTPGTLMLITDHLNLSGQSPLTGPNDERLGVRFPDMSTAYDAALRDCFRQAAEAAQVALAEGVYVGLSGPSYETPAEIRMFSRVGGDSVGMSTVCEVIAARHMGMRVAGVSCITNLAAGLGTTELDHDEVKDTADRVRSQFVSLLIAGLERIAGAVA
jgi:purine-nucleoside phosphorylase